MARPLGVYKHHLANWLAFCGLNQTEFAEKAGAAPGTVSRWTTKARGIPHYRIALLAKALGITEHELLNVDPLASPGSAPSGNDGRDEYGALTDKEFNAAVDKLCDVILALEAEARRRRGGTHA